MRLIDIKQGTLEWDSWRKGKLSASKAPKILGVCPYQTAFELWEEEVGLREPQPTSSNMQKGLDVEDEARSWFHLETGIYVIPACVEHSENPLFIASLDGLSEDLKTGLEIKLVKNEYHEMALQGKITDHYYSQVQHQMFVTGLNKWYYLSWRKENPKYLVIDRDDNFISSMVKSELEFYQMIEDLTPPHFTERDYYDMSNDDEINKIMQEYKLDEAYFKKLQKSLETKKSEIIRHIGDRNAKGKDWKMTKYPIKGRVDYDRIEELSKIDIDQYRRPTTYGYRLTIGG